MAVVWVCAWVVWLAVLRRVWGLRRVLVLLLLVFEILAVCLLLRLAAPRLPAVVQILRFLHWPRHNSCLTLCLLLFASLISAARRCF
jgi:hypothetical protein